MHLFPSQRSRASVLIIVMILCIGLVGLTILFGNNMLMAYRGADNSLAGQQAEQALEGAARYAEYLMAQVTRPGGMADPDTFQSSALPLGDATFWFVGEPKSTDPVDQPAFGLVDEASKLNLNTATTDMLMGLPGMTADLAAAILSWRSASSGSNTGVVLSASSGKTSPFETPDELAIVTGTDASLLYGCDPNLNHAQEATESGSSNSSRTSTTTSTSRIDSGFLEYVTVFSRESNTMTDGTTARVRVTGTGSAALSTLLTNAFGSSRSAEILRKARTSGTSGSVLAFYVHSGMTETEFDQIASSLTAKSGRFLTGLVNANTASATVLACIPGIDATNAAALVAAREQLSTPPASLAWVVPILGDDNSIKAGPYLTANSYQWSVDAAATGRNGRGYRRVRFVLDSSTGTPRIVYRRNLSPLGWALGSTVRDTLLSQKATP